MLNLGESHTILVSKELIEDSAVTAALWNAWNNESARLARSDTFILGEPEVDEPVIVEAR